MGEIQPTEIPANKFEYKNFSMETMESTLRDIFKDNSSTLYGRSSISLFDTFEPAGRSSRRLRRNEKQKNNNNKEVNEMNSNNFKIKVEYLDKNSSYGHSRRIYISKLHSNSHSIITDQVPFPECCGICLFKNYSVSEGLSRSEFKEAFDLIVDHLYSEDKYSKILLYSTDTSNIVRKLAKYDGAVMTGSFKNRRSGNILVGFEIDIIKDHEKYVDEEENEDDEIFFLDGDEDDDEARAERDAEERAEMFAAERDAEF